VVPFLHGVRMMARPDLPAGHQRAATPSIPARVIDELMATPAAGALGECVVAAIKQRLAPSFAVAAGSTGSSRMIAKGLRQ
jgi:hypothetical protein